jgi:hypothetical protein
MDYIIMTWFKNKALSLLLITILPVATIVSCNTQNNGNIVNDKYQGLFLNKNKQANIKRAHLILKHSRSQEIKTYNPDMFSSFGVPLLSGGYKEVRNLYGKSSD